MINCSITAKVWNFQSDLDLHHLIKDIVKMLPRPLQHKFQELAQTRSESKPRIYSVQLSKNTDVRRSLKPLKIRTIIMKRKYLAWTVIKHVPCGNALNLLQSQYRHVGKLSDVNHQLYVSIVLVWTTRPRSVNVKRNAKPVNVTTILYSIKILRKSRVGKQAMSCRLHLPKAIPVLTHLSLKQVDQRYALKLFQWKCGLKENQKAWQHTRS